MKSIYGFFFFFFVLLPRRSLTTLLFLLAIFIILLLLLTTSRSSTTPAPPPPPVAVGVGVDVVVLNSTLLRLASTNPFFPSETAEIESLLSCHDFRTHRSLFHSSWSLFHSSLRFWSSHRHLPPSLLLPPTHFFTSKSSSSCAVVGNSGILLSKSYGSLIDSHDVVIRLNNARIRGFESHVGSKTSVSFVNSNILHLCSRHHHCFCHPYGPDTPILMYICQPIHFIDFVLCNASHTAPLIVTDPRFDRLCSSIVKYYSLKRFEGNVEEWGRLRDERTFHYSSGMQAVMLSLGLCDNVSLFGFGKEVGVKHHYHTNQKAELGLHDYEAEYELYRDLVNRPHAIPFLTATGFKVKLPPVVIYSLQVTFIQKRKTEGRNMYFMHTLTRVEF